MIRYILAFIFATGLFANVIKSPILSVEQSSDTATIRIDNINIGMSGFISHQLSEDNSVILKEIEVIAYNKQTKIATLKLNPFNALRHNSLPSGKWKVEAGDTAILAFAYSRALLIAPNEEVYYRVTKATSSLQWLHPDIFATILSFNSHPTPLKEDFIAMRNTTSVGLVFFFLDKKLYTVDIKTFKVLNISDAPVKQESTKLPFYSRIDKIGTTWYEFGEGTGKVSSYEDYYFNLLIENNPNNQTLQSLYNKYQNR